MHGNSRSTDLLPLEYNIYMAYRMLQALITVQTIIHHLAGGSQNFKIFYRLN